MKYSLWVIFLIEKSAHCDIMQYPHMAYTGTLAPPPVSRHHVVKILDSSISFGGKTAGCLMVEPLEIFHTVLQSALWIYKREERGGDVMCAAFPQWIGPWDIYFDPRSKRVNLIQNKFTFGKCSCNLKPEFLCKTVSNFLKVLFYSTIKFGD